MARGLAGTLRTIDLSAEPHALAGADRADESASAGWANYFGLGYLFNDTSRVRRLTAVGLMGMKQTTRSLPG
jgi:hypothetical protein